MRRAASLVSLRVHRQSSRVGWPMAHMRGFRSSGKITFVSEGQYKATKALGFALGAGLGVALAGTINFFTEFPDPARQIWSQCQTNEKAKALFGENVSREWFWDGSVTEEQASITLKVSGEKAKGSAYGRFIKSREGEWEPILIVARTDDDLVNLYEKKYVNTKQAS